MPSNRTPFRLALIVICLLAVFTAASAQQRRLTKPKRQPKKAISTEAPQSAPTKAPTSNKKADVTKAEDAPLPKGVEHFEQPITREEKGKTTQIGKVDWTTQYIEATGQAVIDLDRYKNPAQAKALAIRGATVVAQRNLLEIVKGVNVQGETTVEDMMTTRDFIVTRVEGIVKGATPVGSPIEKDGLVEVRLRMPLYGDNSLANTVSDQVPPPAESAYTTDSAVAAQAQAGTPTAAASDKGLAFNLNGQKLDPALFPVVVDEQGKVVLDMRKLADKNGKLPAILKSTGDASKVLKQLGVKGKALDVINMLNAEDGKITISNDDAGKFPWKKILNIAKTVGKFLLLLI